jgi:putative flippase GtrA
LLQSFFRYGLAGVLATAVHYAVLVAAVEGGRVPAFLASGLGAVVGAQVAFVLNRRFTFGHEGEVGPAWLKFQGTALLGAAVGMAIVAAGVTLGLHYLLAQVVATLASWVLTFAVNRHWTFR